jgi:hypothetical protein
MAGRFRHPLSSVERLPLILHLDGGDASHLALAGSV